VGRPDGSAVRPGKRLGRPRLQVDDRQLRMIAGENLPGRLAAKALGVSPSSYERLVRGRMASATMHASSVLGDDVPRPGL